MTSSKGRADERTRRVAPNPARPIPPIRDMEDLGTEDDLDQNPGRDRNRKDDRKQVKR